ncbi:HAD family phosphatase [Candidatus Woesearchaeota archaeon]|nr:HAD family phosphatase [Candidatus Woesearchaeota archaeon]
MSHSRKIEAKIRAIITDLGGVLINVDHSNMCAGLARYSSLPAEEIARHFDPRVIKGLEIELGTGKLPPHRFYELMCQELKLKGLSFDEFEMIYSDLFSAKKDTLKLVRALSKKYAIAMLSNTNEIHYNYWLKVLGKDVNLFKELVLSFQAGLRKPDPKIFLEAARRLEVKPGQCVFIDDVEAYVEAARKVGMRGIRFVSAKQLRQDLNKCGVTL